MTILKSYLKRVVHFQCNRIKSFRIRKTSDNIRVIRIYQTITNRYEMIDKQALLKVSFYSQRSMVNINISRKGRKYIFGVNGLR